MSVLRKVVVMRVCRIVLLFLSFSSAIFGQYATVNEWNVTMRVLKDGRDISLMPGTVVLVNKIGKEGYGVSFNGISGMVDKNALVLYNEIFSNVKERIVLSPEIVKEDDKYFLFYFRDGEFFKYNVTERFVLQQQRLCNIQEIYPSTKNNLFLIKGTITNEEEIYNLALFNFSTGKITYIGSFAEKNFSLMDLKFSKSGEYLCILFNVKGSLLACVYKTENGEMISFAKDVLRINWIDQILILSDRNNYWYYHFSNLPSERDISFKKDFLLFKINSDWTTGKVLNSRVFDGLLYLETKKGVISFDIKNKTFSVTPFKSIVFNDQKTLNYFIRNESASLWNLKIGESLRAFEGRQPPIEFVRFCGNKILGRGKYEKIDTFFLYSEEGKEVYRYRAVDSPEAFSESGILAESFGDKNLTFLAIEDPIKQEFFFIVYKDRR